MNVTNTGNAAGKKTVQVYAQKPYTEYDKQNQIEKAAVELVGYGKTKLLNPGESETVTVTVPEYYLTSYDAYGTGVYILDEGAYYLTAAENAHQAANNILAAKGFTEGLTGEGDASLTYSFDQAFDKDTYAKAYGTGADVKALFADADMNRYEGKGSNEVVYYSRSNWEGTVTPGAVKLTMTDEMAKDVVLDDADLPDASGVSFPTMGKNANLQLVNMMDYAYDDPKWDEFMDQLTYEEMASVTLTGLRETAGVTSVGKPATIDHNGPSGVTQKYSIGANGYATVNNDPGKDLKGTCYPCNGIIAATFNDKLAEEVGELIGEDAMWAGYAGLYGTGLNIHRSPYAGRVFEYYSEDGMLTGLIDTAETKGIQSKGVYVYNKHFVMNDQENNRAGIGTWVTEQALREIYLRAFELPIMNADAKCVMTGYNRLGVNWCGAYSALLIDWLRGEAGMKGFAVSDMYDASYMVPVHEIVAGNDIPDGELDLSQPERLRPQGLQAQRRRGPGHARIHQARDVHRAAFPRHGRHQRIHQGHHHHPLVADGPEHRPVDPAGPERGGPGPAALGYVRQEEGQESIIHLNRVAQPASSGCAFFAAEQEQLVESDLNSLRQWPVWRGCVEEPAQFRAPDTK